MTKSDFSIDSGQVLKKIQLNEGGTVLPDDSYRAKSPNPPRKRTKAI
jgi:hypothetical protein